MGKYIDIRYFIVSLAIGLFYIYVSDEHKQVIIMYPTPDNKDEYQYKDKTDSCFTYDLNEVSCPNDVNQYHQIKIQK
jgi:hypothetical protein